MELYPKELFSLFLSYTTKKAELLNIDILDALKKYTPIYFLIGNYDWNIDNDSKYWEELTKRYQKGESLIGAMYSMYKQNIKDEGSGLKWFGCFRYKYVEDSKTGEKIIKLHFRNADNTGLGPLSYSQKEKRLSELKELFTEIKQNYPQAQYVQGGSWLYNLDSYKRLFPQSYTKNMDSTKPKPSMLVIWGQFQDSENCIKKEMATEFITHVQEAKTLEELDQSFKYLELFPKGDIKDFYTFYKIY